MNDLSSRAPVTPLVFRLRSLHIDTAVGVVSGPAGNVRLEPRVMAVLTALCRSPNELVSRQDLLGEIWTGGDVYDEALTQCVYQLRQQLVAAGGSDYRDLITTVPKRGYLLKCDVQAVEPKPAMVGSTVIPVRRRWLAGLLVVTLLLALAWFSSGWRNGPATPAIPPQARSIAVLPFLPLAEEQREPVLELGMADTLITRLSNIRELVVRPVNSVRRYGELDRSSVQAGRDLGVEAVVDGSIQRSGATVRVTVRLLNVADGAALWAGSFDEPFSDIFSVQDSICERIADALSVQLGPQEHKSLVRGGTSNTDAYERYLKGRFHLARLTPPDLLASVGYFQEAVTIDPGYALAWLGLAKAQFRIPIAGEVPPREYYPNAKLAALKALEIDPSLAEGYAILGWIAHWFEWDWAESEAYFKHAIELDDNDTESHLGYSQLLSNTGRNEQALAEVRRARELSPFFLVAAALEGGMLMQAGYPEEAIAQLQQAQQLDEQFWLTHISLAGVYSALGRDEEALSEAQLARKFSGSTWATVMEMEILVRLGRQAEAESLLAGMLERSAGKYVPPFDLAVAFSALGDPDTAMSWLERAFDARDPKMALLGKGQSFPVLSDRPEFAELLRRMNFPEPSE